MHVFYFTYSYLSSASGTNFSARMKVENETVPDIDNYHISYNQNNFSLCA